MNMHAVLELSELKPAVESPSHLSLCSSLSVIASTQSLTQSEALNAEPWHSGVKVDH